MTDLPAEAEHSTLRLMLFEIYEAGHTFPLFVTSDGDAAYKDLRPGDFIVRRYWVREGLDPRGVNDSLSKPRYIAPAVS